MSVEPEVRLTIKKMRKKQKPAIRHEENPFARDMIVPVKGKTVKLSRMGSDNNIVVDQNTGECLGNTHVVTYKKVDSEQFIKLFTANIGLTFGLTSAGIKALSVLLWAMQNKNGSESHLVLLDGVALDRFLNSNQSLKLSPTTFRRGLLELEKGQIIAKNVRKAWYFVNPNFAFNGDRVAFTTLIERSDALESTD